MSEKTPDTLFELLSEFDVIIPIVQRDYAQGRLDEDTTLVRHNLLADMKSAILRKTPPLDLNFVYGKADGKKFIPIDGQQRLTTLFLLHIYAFSDDESKTGLLQNFTYETRTSSRNFLEKLTEKRTSVFKSELIPSEEIIDSDWFVSSWKYDPTIQSVLTMLDDIKKVFGDVENLAQYLFDNEFKPIVFKFLDMKDLGMEDNLYIKLNARGKPLTSLENFKARLIGRLQKLRINYTGTFEKNFDGKWTDLFWSSDKENFDQAYLLFFGVLLMNKGICQTDVNWSNRIDFEKIDLEIIETAFHTLNFLSDNTSYNKVHHLVFNALTEKRTYSDRVLFHAVAAYMYLAKGIDTGSLTQWVRIIQNLTVNSQIDRDDLYRRAIEGINKVTKYWDNLLEYFSQNGNITGFSQEQITEEHEKAKIILQNEDFAKHIYQAEQHCYFSGQIRSALYYAINNNDKPNMEVFIQYWSKISALFDKSKPKHANLLRQALLTFGVYALSVGDYFTLCVDDPNETARTPSLKQLFSKQNNIARQLLDAINLNNDIELQLKNIVEKSAVPKNDWRYCFISFPHLFSQMSASHLRLRDVNGEIILVPNKSSNGYNYEVFSLALHGLLKQNGIYSEFSDFLGTWVDRYLIVKRFHVRFKNGKFTIKDAADNLIFETETDNPVAEVLEYLLAI